jgi:hypothetical protein
MYGIGFRSGEPLKHEDALVEFAPILRLDASSRYAVEYEVPGAEESTIDWLIRIPNGIDLLVEVKNRVGDLVEGLSRLQLCSTAEVGGPPEPAHNTGLLFKSVENKFPSRTPSDAVQAVWIKTYVKQEEAEWHSVFEKLDASRVHVAILLDRCLRHVEITIKIGFQRLIEVLRLKILELRSMHLESSVVHKYVERAELLDRPYDRLLAEILT